MRIPNQSICCALSVLLATAVLTGCSTSNVKVTAQDVAALIGSPQQVIPLRAGFFISGDPDKILVAGTKSPFLGGPEIQQIFEQAARRMFNELVPLTGSETASDYQAKNLDVVLSVESIQPDEWRFVPSANASLGSTWLPNGKSYLPMGIEFSSRKPADKEK